MSNIIVLAFHFQNEFSTCLVQTVETCSGWPQGYTKIASQAAGWALSKLFVRSWFDTKDSRCRAHRAVYALHCGKNVDTLKQCPTNLSIQILSNSRAEGVVPEQMRNQPIIRHAAHAAHAAQMSKPKHTFLSRFKEILRTDAWNLS